jgi:hypothetical protein
MTGPGLLLLSLLACSGNDESPVPLTLSGAGNNAQGHYITRDNQGRVAVSWLESPGEEGKEELFFAIAPVGSAFGTPVKVPGTEGADAAHGECPPELAWKKDGTLYVLFSRKKPTERNRWAGAIYCTSSPDNGRTWSSPQALDPDTSSDRSRSFFDMAVLPDGELGAVWLKGREHGDTTSRGSGIYFARTTPGKGFGQALKIRDNVCECCRTDLFADSNGRLHVTFRAVLPGEVRDMVHAVSFDRGKSFTEAVPVSNDNWVLDGCPHVGPDAVEVNGELRFAWFTMGGKGGIYTCSSADNGKTFTDRRTLVSSEKASHPRMAVTPAGQLLYVWDENFREGNTFVQKIGLKLEGAGRENLLYIDAAEHAHHPLLAVTNDAHAMVVYTVKEKGRGRIVYQRLNLERL